jgi:hypothetical protein
VTDVPYPGRLGDYNPTLITLGVVISHCSMVLDADRRIRDLAFSRPDFDASPASGHVYVDDSYLHEEPEYEQWTNKFWASVSQFLTGAANLSKLFHGTSSDGGRKNSSLAGNEQRRAELRDILRVGPALGRDSRRVRDAMEHVDERLWQRLADVDAGKADPFVVRYAFGSHWEWWESLGEDGDPPLGLYDPASHIVYFLDRDGREIHSNLDHIAAEVERIRGRAIAHRALLVTPAWHDDGGRASRSLQTPGPRSSAPWPPHIRPGN